MDFLERLKPVLPKVLQDLETLYQINEDRVLNQGGNCKTNRRTKIETVSHLNSLA